MPSPGLAKVIVPFTPRFVPHEERFSILAVGNKKKMEKKKKERFRVWLRERIYEGAGSAYFISRG